MSINQPAAQARGHSVDIPDREQIERLSVLAIYKWIFIAAVVLCIPYQLLMGLLGLIGYHTVHWNQQPVTGCGAVFLAPLLGLIAAVLITACIGTAFLAMRYVFSRWQPDEEEP